MVTIAEGLGELGITISHDQIAEMEKLVVHFALRKTHPLTLGGPYLGVDPIAFVPSDYNAIFDLFDIRARDLNQKIREIPAINRNFAVISDPLNILCFWLCHLAPIYIKDKKVCHDFMTNVMKYFHYRIFCSMVNNFFKHGTNREVMEATVAGLKKKSDIINVGSWGALIDSHVARMVDPKDRFYKTIIDGHPDDSFLKMIAEAQTALRAKVKTFANAYYLAHASGSSIGSVSSVSQNSEGEKIIAQSASVTASATSAMITEILNPKMFIHEITINDVVRMSTNVSSRMLKTALLKINETATLQLSSRSFDKTEENKEGKLYIGIRALTVEIIRTVISVCRTRNVNMGNKPQVLKTMKDIYSSSRSTDEAILSVKRSIAHLVDDFGITTNDASKSALRLSVIYYIIVRTIVKMKV